MSHNVNPCTLLDMHTYLVQNKLQNFHSMENIRLKKKIDLFLLYNCNVLILLEVYGLETANST